MTRHVLDGLSASLGGGDRSSWRRLDGAVRGLHAPVARHPQPDTGERRKERLGGNAAVFLDRDGVVIVDKGYVHRSEDVEYVDGIIEFCRKARGLGFRLIVATNQSGIARGLFSEADFVAISEEILERFASLGIDFDAVYYCPHHPTEGSGRYRRNCSCRKPRPGMLLAALDDYRLVPSRCVFVGDRQSDMEAARAAGLGLKLLLQGVAAGQAEADVRGCASLAEAGEALAAFADRIPPA